MIRVPVWWYNLHPDVCAHGQMWDQTHVKDLFADERRFLHLQHDQRPEDGDSGAVVIVAGRFHASDDDYQQMQQDLRDLSWLWLIVTSDEESLFDPRRLVYTEDDVIWLQTPKLDPFEGEYDRAIGVGYSPQCRPTHHAAGVPQRNCNVFFSGQDTHQRRHDMLAEFRNYPRSDILATVGFTQGVEPETYHRMMGRSWVAPCPAGPANCDSFRTWEALEAGCIPLVDIATPRLRQPHYWKRILGPDHPLLEIHYWERTSYLADSILQNPQAESNRVYAFYQQYKRELRSDRDRILQTKTGNPQQMSPITAVITTSPSPLHPSTEHIEQTVESVRERLPDSEILILIDGVRPEQEGRRPVYEEYVGRLLHLCNHTWDNVSPLRFDEHHHQARMLRKALPLIDTPLLLFLEHDTPLVNDIPFDDLACVMTGQDIAVRLIRFSHESHVLEPHEHLMVDRNPIKYQGCRQIGDSSWANVPLRRTVQWSQRPHLASVAAYTEWAETYFGLESCTMIEDVMHGVVQEAWRSDGMHGWHRFGLHLYEPEGNIQRSIHTDARGEDPKFDMVFAYDGDTPEGAPAPTAGRVD